MVAAPRVRVRVARADEWNAVGTGAQRAMSIVNKMPALAEARWPAGKIEVLEAPPAHVGLGSGTQLALAIAAGAETLAGGEVSAAESLANWTGRAQRSAIGLHGFLRGGLIVEAGKRSCDRVGPLVARVDVPRRWRIVLFTPRAAAGLSGAEESSALERVPPVPSTTTAELCRLALLDVVPAAAANDHAGFSQGVYRFGTLVGECFAAVQGGIYAGATSRQLVEELRREGIAGVGQSSWGPTIFAVCEDAAQAERLVERMAEFCEVHRLETIVTAADNQGAVFTPLE